jgi:hypothetical protein
MNKKYILAGVLILGLVVISSCKKTSTTEPLPGNTGSGYFPNSDGNYYKYEISRPDSIGAYKVGTRETHYSGTRIKNSINYQVQIDSITIGGQSVVDFAYFRKTNTGVFYFADTTGLYEFIPDTLRQYISVDQELRTFLFPFENTVSWDVFKMTLNYHGIIMFDPVSVKAIFIGMDSLTLHLNSSNMNVQAAKIQYTLKLQLNPFSQATSNYSAYIWAVNGIGIVKWSGNAAILDPFTGYGINLGDTTSTVTGDIVDYNVQ